MDRRGDIRAIRERERERGETPLEAKRDRERKRSVDGLMIVEWASFVA